MNYNNLVRPILETSDPVSVQSKKDLFLIHILAIGYYTFRYYIGIIHQLGIIYIWVLYINWILYIWSRIGPKKERLISDSYFGNALNSVNITQFCECCNDPELEGLVSCTNPFWCLKYFMFEIFYIWCFIFQIALNSSSWKKSRSEVCQKSWK